MALARWSAVPELSTFNAHEMILIFHILLNVNKLCLNQLCSHVGGEEPVEIVDSEPSVDCLLLPGENADVVVLEEEGVDGEVPHQLPRSSQQRLGFGDWKRPQTCKTIYVSYMIDSTK